MENYKRKLIQRRNLSILLLVAAIILVVFHVVYLISISQSDSGGFNDGFLVGFQFGLIVAIGTFACIEVVKLSNIIKDEHKMKIKFNEEHDERLEIIRLKSGQPILNTVSVVIVIAAIISGYVNFTVFYTLVFVVCFLIIVGAIRNRYYKKHM